MMTRVRIPQKQKCEQQKIKNRVIVNDDDGLRKGASVHQPRHSH